jgi:regulator of protease activity HflC (stomatin/prohibitin superfamily)
MEIFILVLILIVVAAVNIRVVPQAQTYVIERLGAYQDTWSVGIHMKIPLVDKIAGKISMKERILDFPPQPVITKDNVTMTIDTVIYFQVTDPKLYTYGMSNPMMAIETLTATSLRNIVGNLDLDVTLTSRDTINTQMRAILDEATDAWGIKVIRVEVKNIVPPADIMAAMEKQMRAERERREMILRAEGEKTSSILVAEGNRQSTILKAEADKQAAILNAEAVKEATILQANGQAESILMVQEATAKGIELVKAAGADQAVIALKSFEALEKVANGQATKLIIPSNIQDLAGLVASMTEVNKVAKE